MKRDKVISIRVNSDLLEQFQEEVKNCTLTSDIWGRSRYYYSDGIRHSEFKQFTVSDLLEEAMQKYLEEEHKNYLQRKK